MIDKEFEPIRSALERVGIASATDIFPINGGISNGTYNVSTPQGGYIVRNLPGYTPSSRYSNASKDLRYAVLDHLSSKGLPFEVPTYQKDSSGERVIEVGGKYFEVYKKIEGEMTWKPNEKQLNEHARSLAKYHSAVTGQDFGHQEVRVKSLDKILEQFEEVRSGRVQIQNPSVNQIFRDNLAIYEQFANVVSKNKEGLPRDSVLLHGDCHSGNMIYNGNKLIGMIDFDNVKYGPKVFDIAYGAPSDKRYEQFIRAYNEENKLTDQEVKIIPAVQAALALERLANFARTPANGEAQANAFMYISNNDKALYERLTS